MEVAGLALGAVALAGPVYHLYRSCGALFISTRNYTKDLNKCEEKLSVQQRIFERELRLLLQVLVEEDLATAMLEDNDHPQWSDSTFQEKWRSTMGDCFDTPLKITRETLENIQKKLSRLQARVVENKNSISVPPSSKLSKSERAKAVAWRVDWCLVGKDELQRLIGTLRIQNQDLGHLRIQRRSLQKSGSQSRALLPKSPDFKSKLTHQLTVREVARAVYDGLATTARCPCHRVNLQLQNQLDEPDLGQGAGSIYGIPKSLPGSGSPIMFRFIVTKDINVSGCPEVNCECICITINSEPQLSLHKGGCVKKVRFAAEDTQNHIDTSSTRAVITVSGVGKGKGKRVMSIDLGPGAKRIKFEVEGDENSPSTTKSNSGLEAAYDPSMPATISVPEIDDLCLLLAKLQSGEQTKELLGRIPHTEPSPTYQNLMYRDRSTSHPTSRMSLEKILQRSDKHCLLPRSERLKVALVLSLSLLHFGSHSSSWFRERWRSRDIIFFLELQQLSENRSTLHPYVVPSFSKSLESTSNKTDTPATPSRGIARNEQLFSLALVLIEVAFGDTLFKIYEPSKISENNGDDVAEYMKAKMILQSGMLAREMGPVYAEAVSRCLYCDFGIVEEDLSKSELQEVFYEKVVCVLERCLKTFQKLYESG